MQHRQIAICVFGLGLLCLVGISLGASVFSVQAALPAKVEPVIQLTPGSNIACVNATGTGCDAVCGGCYDDVQEGVDAAPSGGIVRIALGTHTGSGSAVVEIPKQLTVVGSYDASCSVPDSGETILDGENLRSVFKVQAGGTQNVELRKLTIKNGSGQGNCGITFGGCGGGLYVKDTQLSAYLTTFTTNLGSPVGTGAGGGVFVDNAVSGASAQFSECAFTSNIGSTNDVGFGGGLYIEAGNNALPGRIEYSEFTGNVASTANEGKGGAAHISGFVDIHETEFSSNFAGTNNAEFGFGGALYLWEAEGMELTNNTIKMNTAVVSPSPLSLRASVGGGIYASTHVSITAFNNIIAKNTARDAGTAIYMESTDIVFSTKAWFWHNTIVGNTGSVTAGAVTIGDNVGTTQAVFINNIVASNTFGIDVKKPSEDSMFAQYTCVWNDTEGFPGDFPVIQDPDLTPEYYPQQGSPVIGAGVLLSLYPGLEADKDGVARPQGAKPNIGAYETTRQVTYMPLLLRK